MPSTTKISSLCVQHKNETITVNSYIVIVRGRQIKITKSKLNFILPDDPLIQNYCIALKDFKR